jgi:hypothetical protein
MYEPAGSEHGVYGDLRNPVEGRRWRNDGNLPLAPGTGQSGGSASAPVGPCHGGGRADLAVVSTVVDMAVDLGA